MGLILGHKPDFPWLSPSLAGLVRMFPAFLSALGHVEASLGALVRLGSGLSLEDPYFVSNSPVA